MVNEIVFIAIGGGAILAFMFADVIGAAIGIVLHYVLKRRNARQNKINLSQKND